MAGNFTEAEEKVIAQIIKLQNLAAKNPSEKEAEAASAKAAELMLRHNLDTAAVERAGDVTAGRRVKEVIEGGFYRWQRDLWDDVADLNFCRYWSQPYYVEMKDVRRKDRFGGTFLTDARVRRRRHRLIGRTVNVRATEVMARYLEGAIERVTVEKNPGRGFNDEYAASFREGVAYRIGQRLRSRRREALEREAAEAADREANARGGASTSTAVTITSYTRSEEDANIDLEFGEGTAAEWRLQKSEEAEQARKDREAYAKWAAENPDEARKEEEKRVKAAEKRAASRSRERFGGVKHDGAFWAGAEAADEISLEPQMSSREPRKIASGRSR